MALFARRRLYRVLNENAAFLSAKQVETACTLLNSVRDEYLSTEWEQVILNAARKFGSVVHEPDRNGRRTPDLLFKAHDQSIEFVADIATASDKGINKDNPTEAFQEEFIRHLAKADLLYGGFDTQFEHYPNPMYRGSGQKVRLKLPPRGDFTDKIFNSDFRAFLRRVKAEPEKADQFDAVGPDVGVHIKYARSITGFSSSGHLSYTGAKVIDKNPIYNALKAKGDQLKAVGREGISGIFLCDGGCEMLRSDRADWAVFSVKEIINRFFSHFSSIDFVAVFVVRQEHGSSWQEEAISVESKLYLSRTFRADCVALAQVVANIHKALPTPEDIPENAMRQLRRHDGMSGRYLGRLHMGGDVTMSARKLLELLAGKKTVAEFNSDYEFNLEENPFYRALAQGRLITKITVEPHPGKDDDTVTIEFGEPDAAISPIRVEKKKE